jgi:hypothetical protein
MLLGVRPLSSTVDRHLVVLTSAFHFILHLQPHRAGHTSNLLTMHLYVENDVKDSTGPRTKVGRVYSHLRIVSINIDSDSELKVRVRNPFRCGSCPDSKRATSRGRRQWNELQVVRCVGG